MPSIGPPVLEGPSIGISSTGGASERASAARTAASSRWSWTRRRPSWCRRTPAPRTAACRIRVSGVRRPAVDRVPARDGPRRPAVTGAAAAAADLERGPADPSLAYLFARLVAGRARASGAAVDRRRAVDPDPDDRFRGLYISDEQVDGLLDGRAGSAGPARRRRGVRRRCARRSRRGAAEAEAAGADIRLRRARRGVRARRRSTSSCCWSPSRRTSTRASSGSTATSTTTSRGAGRASAWPSSCAAAGGRGRRPGRATGSARSAPLVAGGLLLVEDADRPFLTRSLRVPDRVTAHLLGDDSARPDRRGAADDVRSPATSTRSTPSSAALAAGVPPRLRPRAARGGRPLARPRPRSRGSAGRRSRSTSTRLAAGRRPGADRGRGARARRGCAARASSSGRSRRSPSAGAAAVRAFAEAAGPGRPRRHPRLGSRLVARAAAPRRRAGARASTARHELWRASLDERRRRAVRPGDRRRSPFRLTPGADRPGRARRAPAASTRPGGR